MKQITIVSQKTNQELYNFLCSKYSDYAILHNNKELIGFKITPIISEDIKETSDVR